MSAQLEIRAACASDEDGLLELASHLDTVNLPHDVSAIRRILDLSERSFNGAIGDPRRREYVFVLHDLKAGRAAGTSMVIGQLGHRGSPYIYFNVDQEERYSATLDRYFVHKVLSIRYSYHGPTELGGLVVHPDYRGHPMKLGRLISFVRMLFVGTRPGDFQDELLAELLPPLMPDGRSHLWEALGRHFTGLDYLEADRLSKRNKEFIRGLFPAGEIYASLLPAEAREVIGEVGPHTKGVARMLGRAGFEYARRVDPFDGGPHYTCLTDRCTPVRQTREVQLEPVAEFEGAIGLIARRFNAPPYFVAVPTPFKERDPGHVMVPEAAAKQLDAAGTAPTWLLQL